jgi:hypothetical protein
MRIMTGGDGRGLCPCQVDGKRAALPEGALHVDRAARVGDDCVHQRQTETGAAADLLGGEERPLRGRSPEEFGHGVQQLGALERFGERSSGTEREGGLGVQAAPGIKKARDCDNRNLDMLTLYI